jgi:hypothetical protein
LIYLLIFIRCFYLVLIKLSKPEHQNARLEELIAGKQGEPELRLNLMQLTAQDIEILVYYGLQDNKVSNIIFDISTRVEQNSYRFV